MTNEIGTLVHVRLLFRMEGFEFSSAVHDCPFMPQKFNASRRHKIPKARSAVKNWPEYKASLRQRGDLRVRTADDVAAHWTLPGKRTPKGDPVDTDLAIETVLTLRLVFHQPLRQTEGIVGSIPDLIGRDLPVSDHSTLSRRGRGLKRSRRRPSTNDSLDLVVVKIFGPGEWQQKYFGERKKGMAGSITSSVMAPMTVARPADC